MDANKNIVLIGFMGTGKSTVGKVLAKRTGRTLVDIDQKIEDKEKKRISEIFEKDGEAAFRKLEKQTIGRAVLDSNLVITTGGGAVLDPENFEALKKRGVLVTLEASFETIVKRVKDARTRPLLRSSDVPGEIKRLLEARKPFYDKADLKIATDGKSAHQVAEEILEKLSGEEIGSGKDSF